MPPPRIPEAPEPARESAPEPASASRGIGAVTGGDPYLPQSGNGGYRVIRYELDLDYRIRTNRLDATALISAQATHALTRFSLDLVGLQVGRVTVNGVRAARVVQTVGKVSITPATRLVPGETFTVAVKYVGYPRSVRSAWGEVGWEELDDGVLVAGQPSGAPTWFPCDDRPNAKAPFLVRIVCDSQYRPVANGRLVSRQVRSTRTVWLYETAEPMAPYLATLQIGRYDERMLPETRIAQHVYYPRDHAESVGDDFRDQPRMMDLFEKLFGPYPFSDYSVIVTDDELEIPLEAHGMAVFGRNHIDGADGSERLIAHELAHQWFGNSVTAESWQHIWLHEGFACYAEWLWSEASGGASADSLARMHWARVDKFPKDLVIGDPGPARMFDDRVYKRGALTLHALRLTVGKKAFFALLRGWTAANRFGAVTTADFVEHAARSSTVPVRELLHAWLELPRLPRLPAAHSGSVGSAPRSAK